MMTSTHLIKNLVICVSILFGVFTVYLLPAQSPCTDCPCLVRKADETAALGEFQMALKFFNAAIVCDSSKTDIINKKISGLFERINALWKDAEEGKSTLENEKKRAEENLNRAITAEQTAKGLLKKERERQKELVDLTQKQQRLLDDLNASRDSVANYLLKSKNKQDSLVQLNKSLHAAYLTLTDSYITDAKNFIDVMYYTNAHNLLKKIEAFGIQDKRTSLDTVYFELAYFYSEVKMLDTASLVMNTLLRRLNYSHILSNVNPSQEEFRKILSALNQGIFTSLEAKYYPPSSMMTIPGGTFRMGSNQKGKQYANERPLRTMTIEKFDLSPDFVTNFQFFLFELQDTSQFAKQRRFIGKRKGKDPVSTTWIGAQAYISWLNTIKNKSYRLPEEKEWEYVLKNDSLGKNNIKTYYSYIEYESSSNNIVTLMDRIGEWCVDIYKPTKYEEKEYIKRYGHTLGSSPPYRVVRGKNEFRFLRTLIDNGEYQRGLLTRRWWYSESGNFSEYYFRLAASTTK